MNTLNPQRFYVYSYSDPETLIPFYIGKGTNQRYKLHWNNPFRVTNEYFKEKLLLLKDRGLNPLIKMELIEITQYEALRYERDLIKKYGRIGIEEFGVLTNRYLDGETKAVWLSEDARRIMSIKAKNRKTPHPMFGRKHSEETKQHWSKIRKGRVHTDETKSKMKLSSTKKSKGIIEEPNGNKFYCIDIKSYCNEVGISFNSILTHKKYKGYKRISVE